MWTFLQALGLNKWLVYGAIAASAVATLGVMYLNIRASGAQSEKNRQLVKTLTHYQQEVRERAHIEALRSDAARKQLRDKWSAR